MRRLARLLADLLGYALVAFGWWAFLWVRLFGTPEKPGRVHVLGHNWDVDWEVVLPCVAAGMCLLLFDWPILWRRARPGICAQCGYDLRATPVRCPECGSAAAPSARADSPG